MTAQLEPTTKTEPMVSTKIKYLDKPRGREVQITRLRLGRVLLNQWLCKMKIHPDGRCEVCRVPDRIEHLLLQCTRNNISNKLQRKCEELNVECSVVNLLQHNALQREVAQQIYEMNKGKIL